MYTPPQIPPFEFGTPESFDALRSTIPPRLMALAAKGPVLLGLDSPTIVVAGMAHLASALGRSVLLDDGTHKLAAGFNLAVMADACSATEWLPSIGKGWLDEAASLRSLNTDEARALIRQYMQEIAVREPRSRAGDPQIDLHLDHIPENVVNMLRTQYVGHKTDPVAMAHSLVHSSDHAAAALNGIMDPFHEWSRLTPGKQRQLAEMLTRSWMGKPMEMTSKGDSVLASLTCLWQTHISAVRDAFRRKPPTLTQTPPPILLLRQQGTSKRFPGIEAMEFVEWARVLNTAFASRLQSVKPAVMVLEPEVKLLAATWFTQFEAALAKTPQPLQPWLSWLPDLALRIYQVLLMSSSIHTALITLPGDKEQNRPLSLVEKQKTMSDAIALTRWLAQEHFQAVQSIIAGGGLTFTDSTDTEALEDDILQRLKDQGPLHPRDLQRSFHALSAHTRDNAIQKLKSKGLVTIEPDGMLRQAA